MSDVDWLLLVSEDFSGVGHQPLVVAISEAGAVEVGAEDRDLEAAHDSEFMSLLDEPSLPFIQGMLVQLEW